MKNYLIAASLGLAVALGASLPAVAQGNAPSSPDWNTWQYQATQTRTRADGPRTHRKVYYGVGFGQHHRTTVTGGKAGGYSDRN